MLPSFEYYTSEYHGNEISEVDFARLISRAGNYLKKVKCDIPTENYKNAVCAVAEAWQVNEQGGTLTSQRVGSWTKTYASNKKSDNQRLLDALSLYADCKTVGWL